MRTGLLIIGFGLTLLILPVGLFAWVHHMHAIGLSMPEVALWFSVVLAAAPGIVVVGQGARLVWLGSRRTNSN
jgi:hypothetical protein